MERIWIAIAGLSGAVAVAADAASQHLLAGDPWRMGLAMTAARYGLFHAAALLGLALLSQAAWRGGAGRVARLSLAAAGWCFCLAILLFCGSLYALAAGAPIPVAHATPVGGTLFIIGWLAVLVHALAPRPAA